MKTKSFVPFFTLPVAADVKSMKILRKKLGLPRLLPQIHDHKVFHYKFLLKSSDNVCISTFVNINLINKSTKQYIFWKSLDFIFFFLPFSSKLLYHKHQTVDLVKKDWLKTIKFRWKNFNLKGQQTHSNSNSFIRT
jgi:TRAP-type mannitol/chloroaromatic compound transport system permease small subunit